MRALVFPVVAGLSAVGLLAACQSARPVPADPQAPAVQAAVPAAAPVAPPTSGAPQAAAPAPAGAQPAGKGRIEVAEKSVDLGGIKQGEKATHTFVLKNVGTDVLHIRRAQGS